MNFKNKRQTRHYYDRVILDLCGGTGSWSRPYRRAGYDVKIITLPEHDVRWFEKLDRPVHGILAAPPCSHFSIVGAQHWAEKDEDGRTLTGLSIVDACMRITAVHDPEWWVLENPSGRLERWLGSPDMTFNPCDYGDPWTKKTCLWGDFTKPQETSVEPRKWSDICSAPGWAGRDDMPDSITEILNSYEGEATRKTIRSITPPGFAKAFFRANP